MEAGRELDALVAEMVLGYKLMRWINHPSYEPVIINDGSGSCLPIGLPIPRYSTDIAAAWQVVQKLLVDNPYLAIERDVLQGNAIWKVEHREQWKDHDWQPVFADTAPLAICLAALETVKQRLIGRPLGH